MTTKTVMKNTKTLTVAREIAACFGNDGMRFSTSEGETMEEICVRRGGERYLPDDRERGMERYRFADGSAIVIHGDAWDVEGSRPYSWADHESEQDRAEMAAREWD